MQNLFVVGILVLSHMNGGGVWVVQDVVGTGDLVFVLKNRVE